MAVAQGYAENVLVFRALNGRSGSRVGSTPLPGVAAQYRYPIGYSAYLMYIAMWARRFLHETGGSEPTCTPRTENTATWRLEWCWWTRRT